MKGGKREGAGRPFSEPTSPVSLRLNAEQKVVFFDLGGAQWAKAQIDKEIKKRKRAMKGKP